MHLRRREGLKSFPGSLGKDHLSLHLLPPLELAPVHAAILLAPAELRRLRHADLAHRIGDRRPLPLQHFDLPKLQHNLFRFVSLPRHLWSS